MVGPGADLGKPNEQLRRAAESQRLLRPAHEIGCRGRELRIEAHRSPAEQRDFHIDRHGITANAGCNSAHQTYLEYVFSCAPVCVYTVCIFIRIYVCLTVHLFVRYLIACVGMSLRTYTYACMHAYIHTYIHTYIHIHTYTYIHAYIRMYVRT